MSYRVPHQRQFLILRMKRVAPRSLLELFHDELIRLLIPPISPRQIKPDRSDRDKEVATLQVGI